MLSMKIMTPRVNSVDANLIFVIFKPDLWQNFSPHKKRKNGWEKIHKFSPHFTNFPLKCTNVALRCTIFTKM